MTAAFDLFALTVAALAGAPLPPLPALPGRAFRPLGDIPAGDPHADAWDAQHTAPDDLQPHVPDPAGRVDNPPGKEPS